MPRKSSSVVATPKSAKSVREDEESGSEEEVEVDTPSRRRSARTPKPVVKKSLKDASDSEDEDDYEEDSDDSSARKVKRTPAKKTTAKGGKANGTSGVKRPATNGSVGKSSKKLRKEKNAEELTGDEGEDEMENGSDEDEGSETGDDNEKKEDEPEQYDLNFEDEEEEDPNWVEPKYDDKDWFKKNCLLCQICNKSYPHTGDALKCFHKHKDRLRCYVCFLVLKGGKDGTKRLFKHYQNRHQPGDKPNTVKCPHCNDSFAYKSVSCHIISIHFREALGIPDKAKLASSQNGAAAKTKAKPKPKSNGKKVSDEEVEDEDEGEEEDEVEEEEEEEEEED